MAIDSQFRVPEAFSKPPDEVLNFELMLLDGNWSQNRGNFGGSIDIFRQISLGVEGLRNVPLVESSSFQLVFIRVPSAAHVPSPRFETCQSFFVVIFRSVQ